MVNRAIFPSRSRLLHRYDPAFPGIGVPVVLSSGVVTIKTIAKLDTGASFCIFKREHGEELGLDVETGTPQRIGTATEPFLVYGHNVSLSALGFDFYAMVFFAANTGFRRNVLGRRGWMERIRLALVDYDGELYASRYDDAT